MLIRPSAVHSAIITSGFGTSRAIVGGVRKIPLPMVMPTMSAMPPASPMPRRRSCVSEGAAVVTKELASVRPKVAVRLVGCHFVAVMTNPRRQSRREFLGASAFGLLEIARGSKRSLSKEVPLGEELLYVGTYTDDKRPDGIYLVCIDTRSGQLRLSGSVDAGPNPSFLAIHPNRRVLYAVNEVDVYRGKSSGAVSTFTIAGSTGALAKRSEEHTSELQSQFHLVCRLLLEKKKKKKAKDNNEKKKKKKKKKKKNKKTYKGNKVKRNKKKKKKKEIKMTHTGVDNRHIITQTP